MVANGTDHVLMLIEKVVSPLSSRAKPTCPGVPWRDMQFPSLTQSSEWMKGLRTDLSLAHALPFDETGTHRMLLTSAATA